MAKKVKEKKIEFEEFIEEPEELEIDDSEYEALETEKQKQEGAPTEEIKSPEKWAKGFGIDPMLVVWWQKQNRNINKQEFLEILEKLKIKME